MFRDFTDRDGSKLTRPSPENTIYPVERSKQRKSRKLLIETECKVLRPVPILLLVI